MCCALIWRWMLYNSRKQAMIEKRRLSPEESLKLAQQEEKQKNRGELKIFFGASPGVGKTFMMLEDAQKKRKEGVDIVVGVVETHGRKEVKALLEGFEQMHPHKTMYRGKTLSEFDLDAALKRFPTLILLDEMAHTNAPGSRHLKRWQDIQELLDRGINVYTTLNVQHLESLNDIVWQITGVRVHETIPDSIFEMANTIELVDLPPDDLLKRLQEGKVYIPEVAELALKHFFRRGNLFALRELAMRVAAEQVGTQVLTQRREQGIIETWPTVERLLVCIGPEPNTSKLIRAAKRMAKSLHAEWIAVHVEAPRVRLTQAQHNEAIHNLRLAEQLGAETLILTGVDVVEELIRFAHERNVTKIVLGKNIRPRWKDYLFGSLVNELVRYSGEIDIYVLTGERESISLPRSVLAKRPEPIPWRLYAYTFLLVSLATLANLVIHQYLQLSNIVMVYLLVVVMVAMRGLMGPALVASLLSVIAYDLFFILPYHSLSSSNLQSVITLMMMLLVAYVISHLTVITRKQADAAHIRERRISALHELGRKLAAGRELDEIVSIGVRYISEAFDSEVLLLLPDKQRLSISASYPSKQSLNDKEFSVAQWVFDLGQIAGMGTGTLPSTDAIYVPLLTSHGSVGVLMVRPLEPDLLLVPEQLHLLEACARQIALAIEIGQLYDKSKH
jgi:two-component system sensor histidine kinase KdpD